VPTAAAAAPAVNSTGNGSSKNGTSSKQQQQQQRVPDGVKVCDSSSWSFEEVVGPVQGDACGSYEVRGN
jgi:hypothetical protein